MPVRLACCPLLHSNPLHYCWGWLWFCLLLCYFSECCIDEITFGVICSTTLDLRKCEQNYKQHNATTVQSCKYFQVEKTKATTCKVWGREWGRSAAIAYQVLAQLATELPEQPPFPDVFPLFVCCIDSWWCLHRERRRMRRYRCRCFGYKWVMTGWWVAIISCANSHAVCTANAVQVTAAISEPLKNLVA